MGLGQLPQVTSSILQTWMSQLVYSSTGAFVLKEPIAIDFLVLMGPSACLGSCWQKDPKYKWGWISRQPLMSLSDSPSLQHPCSISLIVPLSDRGHSREAAHTLSCSGRAPGGEEGSSPRHSEPELGPKSSAFRFFPCQGESP